MQGRWGLRNREIRLYIVSHCVGRGAWVGVVVVAETGKKKFSKTKRTHSRNF